MFLVSPGEGCLDCVLDLQRARRDCLTLSSHGFLVIWPFTPLHLLLVCYDYPYEMLFMS